MIFYVNYGRIVRDDMEWVQGRFMSTVDIYERVVIKPNDTKTK